MAFRDTSHMGSRGPVHDRAAPELGTSVQCLSGTWPHAEGGHAPRVTWVSVGTDPEASWQAVLEWQPEVRGPATLPWCCLQPACRSRTRSVSPRRPGPGARLGPALPSLLPGRAPPGAGTVCFIDGVHFVSLLAAWANFTAAPTSIISPPPRRPLRSRLRREAALQRRQRRQGREGCELPAPSNPPAGLARPLGSTGLNDGGGSLNATATSPLPRVCPSRWSHPPGTSPLQRCGAGGRSQDASTEGRGGLLQPPLQPRSSLLGPPRLLLHPARRVGSARRLEATVCSAQRRYLRGAQAGAEQCNTCPGEGAPGSVCLDVHVCPSPRADRGQTAASCQPRGKATCALPLPGTGASHRTQRAGEAGAGPASCCPAPLRVTMSSSAEECAHRRAVSHGRSVGPSALAAPRALPSQSGAGRWHQTAPSPCSWEGVASSGLF